MYFYCFYFSYTLRLRSCYLLQAQQIEWELQLRFSQNTSRFTSLQCLFISILYSSIEFSLVIRSSLSKKNLKNQQGPILPSKLLSRAAKITYGQTFISSFLQTSITLQLFTMVLTYSMNLHYISYVTLAPSLFFLSFLFDTLSSLQKSSLSIHPCLLWSNFSKISYSSRSLMAILSFRYSFIAIILIASSSFAILLKISKGWYLLMALSSVLMHLSAFQLIISSLKNLRRQSMLDLCITAQRLQTLLLIQINHSQSLEVCFQPNAQTKTEYLRLYSQVVGLAVIYNVGEEVLVYGEPYNLYVFVLLKGLGFEAFRVIAIDVGNEDKAAFVALPGIVAGLRCWYFREMRDYGSCFLQKLSLCIFLVVVVVVHASRKLQSKAMHRRPKFHDHQQLRFLIFVPDNRNDINSIDLSLLRGSPEHLLITIHTFAYRIIDHFHAEPLPSINLSLFDHSALFMWFTHCQIQDMRII